MPYIADAAQSGETVRKEGCVEVLHGAGVAEADLVVLVEDVDCLGVSASYQSRLTRENKEKGDVKDSHPPTTQTQRQQPPLNLPIPPNIKNNMNLPASQGLNPNHIPHFRWQIHQSRRELQIRSRFITI